MILLGSFSHETKLFILLRKCKLGYYESLTDVPKCNRAHLRTWSRLMKKSETAQSCPYDPPLRSPKSNERQNKVRAQSQGLHAEKRILLFGRKIGDSSQIVWLHWQKIIFRKSWLEKSEPNRVFYFNWVTHFTLTRNWKSIGARRRLMTMCPNVEQDKCELLTKMA